MNVIRSGLALVVVLMSASIAAAQIPPPMAPPLVPNPNPSSSLVLPPTREVPVSPATPGTIPGATAPGYRDIVTGTDQIIARPEPKKHVAHRHRHRRGW
jgi:hypothetical protein